MGNSPISSMTIKDTTLYAAAPRFQKGQVLYAIDLLTWEVTEVAILAEKEEDAFYRIENILWLEEYLYILGWIDASNTTVWMSDPGNNKILGRISILEEDAQIEVLDVDSPVEILLTKENTLLIHHYNEESGYGFLEYTPKEETVKEVGFKSIRVIGENFCLCEDGYLFRKIDTEALYYGTLDGIEAQIVTDTSTLWNKKIIYQNGFAFYYDYQEMMVERVKIAGAIKENQEIRLLINHVDAARMYGAGYKMIRKEVDRDTFSLKVLAQDTDFDLYLLSSIHSNAYNLKKNGAFYPLNDIPAVEQYLDACFPYVREIATNEDGDIWMIPIKINIPILMYDKVYCKLQGVDFSKMNFLDFLSFTERAELEDAEKIALGQITSEFFDQYFRVEDSFDTELFREYAKQLKSLYHTTGEDIYPDKYLNEILPEFYYEYLATSEDCLMFWDEIEQWELEETLGVIEVPKIAEELNNVGTCYFFAVNPQSDNLETTLTYLSDLCTYLMTVKNSFLLADATTYTDTPFLQQCYELYKNGTLYFAVDEEVYDSVFTKYLKGEIELEEMIEEAERRLEIYKKE